MDGLGDEDFTQPNVSYSVRHYAAPLSKLGYGGNEKRLAFPSSGLPSARQLSPSERVRTSEPDNKRWPAWSIWVHAWCL